MNDYYIMLCENLPESLKTALVNEITCADYGFVTDDRRITCASSAKIDPFKGSLGLAGKFYVEPIGDNEDFKTSLGIFQYVDDVSSKTPIVGEEE